MTPTELVHVLLEDDSEADDFLDRHVDMIADKYQQIGGDRDWWTYGGTFYNPAQSTILHIPGLEGEGLEDKSSWDMELTPEDLEAINQQFPPDIDPDDPTYDLNADDREEAQEARKQAKADAFNRDRKIRVYRFLDDNIEDWGDQLDDLRAQMPEGEFDALPNFAKWIEIGNHWGFDELDPYPDRYTKEELEKYLGLKS